MLRLLLILAAAGCHLQPAPILDRTSEFQRGVSLGLFAGADDVDYDERLAEIRALGASDVSFVITWVQEDAFASEVRTDPLYTPDPALVRRLARRAHALGLRVMLFPILRLVHRTAAQWRGSIQPGDLDRWFATYGARLVELAALADEEGIERLTVGSELASTERRADEWERLIARVRKTYRGQLIYSANWDHYGKVPFWRSIDVIGVSAYWSVAPKGERPTVDGAVAAWRPLRARLAAFQKRVGRPLVLTEVGYQSQRGAGAAPWNDFLEGEERAWDDEAQRRLYEAFTRAWSDDPSLSGVYFWVWFADGGRGDDGYTPRRKPAAEVLRAWYRPPERVPPMR